MKLTEKFYMMTECGLVEVAGKRINDSYAITRNHKQNTYAITHINTGLCVSSGYSKIKDCMEKVDAEIKRGDGYLKNNPDKLIRMVNTYNYCIKENLIESLI